MKLGIALFFLHQVLPAVSEDFCAKGAVGIMPTLLVFQRALKLLVYI